MSSEKTMVDYSDEYSEFDIAIIGMAGRFPGASNVDQFWENLKSEVESIKFFTDDELLQAGVSRSEFEKRNYVKASPAIDNPGSFDEEFFGYSPREAAYTDPQQRFFLETAWEAIESAGYNVDDLDVPVGVFAGSAMNTYLINTKLSNRFNAEYLPVLIGNDNSFLATRVSYKLNLTGPSVTMQTACSSSLVSIHTACQSILSGECDMALAGGVSIRVPNDTGYVYTEGSVFSPDGHCRPFDAKANGTIFGSGVGVVFLKSLEMAIRDNDEIHAIVKGSAINNDGSSKADYTAPSVDSQSSVIVEALSNANLSADDITYVEAHGTGTNIGDPIEIAALCKAYNNYTNRKQYCAIGSVKSNIGHLDAAAGVTGLIKTALGLKNKTIPASLNYDEPNPQIEFQETPFYVNQSTKQWPDSGKPRRAAITSLGMGGTNAHIILQEPPKQEQNNSKAKLELIVLSARSNPSLVTAANNLKNFLQINPTTNLNAIAQTLRNGRKAFGFRFSTVCHSVEELITELTAFTSSKDQNGHQKLVNPEVVFLFPGVASQYPSMGHDLYHTEAVFQTNVDECLSLLPSENAEAFRTHFLSNLDDAKHDSKLMQETGISMPGIFIIEYAIAQLWLSRGVTPSAMIGHSLGEYVAATLAGNLVLADAIKLVLARGLLYDTIPEGGMLSLNINEDQAKKYLQDDMSIAVINDSKSCVLSGSIKSIELTEKELQKDGIQNQRLKTSRAMHSPMTDGILDDFRKHTDTVTLHQPEIPYISNVTGNWASSLETNDTNYWVTHLRHPVRFGKGLANLLNDTNRIYIEVGPGTVCTTLTRRNSLFDETNHRIISSMPHPLDKLTGDKCFLQAIGKYWQNGGLVDWSVAFDSEIPNHKINLPTYPFQKNDHWYKERAIENTENSKSEFSLALEGDRIPYYYQNWKRLKSLFPADQPQNLDKAHTKLVLFSDGSDFSNQLISLLSKHNYQIFIVVASDNFEVDATKNTYSIRPEQYEDYVKLFKDISATQTSTLKMVHLWSISQNVQDESIRIRDQFDIAQQTGYFSVTRLAKAIVNNNINTDIELSIFTNKLHDVFGNENTQPETGTLIGPLRVLSQEYPHIKTQGIDINSDDFGNTDASTLLALKPLARSIIRFEQSLLKAYRNGYFWEEQYSLVSSPKSSKVEFKNNGIYLITGGLGTLGLLFANTIAEQVENPTLILVSRTAIPKASEWESLLDSNQDDDPTSKKIAALDNLRQKGANIITVKADVSLPGTIDNDIASHRLNGVIHAAGIVEKSHFKTVEDTNDEASEIHFNPKIRGTLNLMDSLKDQDPDFVLIMSSIASILGGIGHMAYTSANACVDAYVRRHNKVSNQKWHCGNWDIWKTDGTSDTLESDENSTLSSLGISKSYGQEILSNFLSFSEPSPLVISSVDLQPRIDQWLKSKNHSDSAHKTEPVQNVIPNSVDLHTNTIESYVKSVWQEHLGINNIASSANFTELGGNSLVGTQIIAEIRQHFEVKISLSDLFTYPNVSLLSEHIEQQIIQLKETENDEINQALASIESMTDEEN